jgi:SPP1 family predicted phage head-tail adaptor
MEAGKLRQRVTIQTPVRTTDSRTGQRTAAWTTLATNVPAQVTPRAAAEQEQAKQQVSQTTYDVSLRYRPDVTSDCRLVYQGKVLAVTGVVNVDERNRELRLDCTGTGEAVNGVLSLGTLSLDQLNDLTL